MMKSGLQAKEQKDHHQQQQQQHRKKKKREKKEAEMIIRQLEIQVWQLRETSKLMFIIGTH